MQQAFRPAKDSVGMESFVNRITMSSPQSGHDERGGRHSEY